VKRHKWIHLTDKETYENSTAVFPTCIFYCWFTFMLMGTQPRDVSVSIKGFKSQNVFSPPPICTVTNGESARPARYQLIGHTGNKTKKKEGKKAAPFSLMWYIETVDGSTQRFLSVVVKQCLLWKIIFREFFCFSVHGVLVHGGERKTGNIVKETATRAHRPTPNHFTSLADPGTRSLDSVHLFIS